MGIARSGPETATSVTPQEPSQAESPHVLGDGRLAIMFKIVIGSDESGSIPLLLRDEDALSGDALRWRLIARTDDEGIAKRLMEVMARRCFSEPPGVA